LQPTWNPNRKTALIVNGFSKEVLNKLPMEFAVEAQKLLEILLKVLWDKICLKLRFKVSNL
jgi:hypothetical protein